MPKASDEIFLQTRIPATAARALENVLQREGLSAAAWLRRLVLSALAAPSIRADVVEKGRAETHAVSGRGGFNYLLIPTRQISATERSFQLLTREGQAMTATDLHFFVPWKDQQRYRFLLEGSPMPWEIVTFVSLDNGARTEVTLRVAMPKEEQ